MPRKTYTFINSLLLVGSMDRGFMIEKAQPFDKYDIELAKHILEKHEQLVVGIGNAGYSYERNALMTAGERIELTDYVLQNNGVDPSRYIIVPIENSPENLKWAAKTKMMTPSWNTFYTRNFKNANIMQHFAKQFGIDVQTIKAQKTQIDLFELLAHDRSEFTAFIDPHALTYMYYLGIDKRAKIEYLQEDVKLNQDMKTARTLFLGGLQPMHGVYADGTGHIGVIKNIVKSGKQAVIAIGSGQISHTESDPLTVGERIDVVRRSLIANGVSPYKFFTIPIKDIAENALFAPKVIAYSPRFDSFIAGNDWTLELFGSSGYEQTRVERTMSDGKNLSATRVRNVTIDTLRDIVQKQETLSNNHKSVLDSKLQSLVDPATIKALRDIGFYERMKFLAFAKE